MPLHTGRQIPIGNGSSVALLGVQQVDAQDREHWEEEPGHWVYFLAHIECAQVPPTGTAKNVIQSHARAIWTLMCPNTFERPHTSLIYPPHDEDAWMRVMFRRRIEGKLRASDKYLHATAQVLENFWTLVRYAEYGEANENKAITRHSEERTPCPIRTQLVDIQKRTPMWTTAVGASDRNLPLGFILPEAETVASSILMHCRMNGWVSLHNYGLREGDTITNHLMDSWQMTNDEFQAGIRFLIDNDYLAEGDGNYLYFVREKFVVHCWHASLSMTP